jgi:hypothetical protein
MQRNLNIFATPSLNLWCHLSAPRLGHKNAALLGMWWAEGIPFGSNSLCSGVSRVWQAGHVPWAPLMVFY